MSSEIIDAVSSMAKIIKDRKSFETSEQKMKNRLIRIMDKYGVKSVETMESGDECAIRVIRIRESKSTVLDLKMLKSDDPDLYERLIKKYPKTAKRPASIRIVTK